MNDRKEEADKLEALVRRQMELLELDLTQPGLERTPVRVAKSLRWLTRGYHMSVEEVLSSTSVADEKSAMAVMDRDFSELSKMEKEDLADQLEREMMAAAEKLDFERAALLRDQIDLLKGRAKPPHFTYSQARRKR